MDSKSIREAIGLATNDAELHEAIINGLSFSVFLRTAAVIDIDKRQLAVYLCISHSKLSRRVAKGYLTPDESDKLYRFVETLLLSVDYFENLKDAINWMQSEVKGLGYKKPVDLIATTLGAQMVKDLIGRLTHGILA